jgi:hypothetical protein
MMLFEQGIQLFRSVSEDSTVRKFQFPVNHLDDRAIPSGRRAIQSRRPDRPSIICLDDVDFRPDPSLYQEASILACIRPDNSAARSDALQYSIKLSIVSKIIYGKIAATVRTTWISIRTRFS